MDATLPPVIFLAATDAQIDACFPVMVQLRPQLQAQGFVAQIRRLAAGGFLLAGVEVDRTVVAVAGFRLTKNLSRGRFVYVDDLVVDGAWRSRGYGQALLDWLVDYATRHHCTAVELDSGVQRFAAHRFYFQQRMVISAHHFSLPLDAPASDPR